MALDIVTMQMCSSIAGPRSFQVGVYHVTDMFNERFYPKCTCDAYKYAKRTVSFGNQLMPEPCKHIKKAEQEVCGWHEQYSESSQTEQQTVNRICPDCGGKTIYVRVAI